MQLHNIWVEVSGVSSDMRYYQLVSPRQTLESGQSLIGRLHTLCAGMVSGFRRQEMPSPWPAFLSQVRLEIHVPNLKPSKQAYRYLSTHAVSIPLAAIPDWLEEVGPALCADVAAMGISINEILESQQT